MSNPKDIIFDPYMGVGSSGVAAIAHSRKFVGAEIAKKSVELGHKKVTFDRSGYKYHGRVKALAEAARDGGLEF